MLAKERKSEQIFVFLLETIIRFVLEPLEPKTFKENLFQIVRYLLQKIQPKHVVFKVKFSISLEASCNQISCRRKTLTLAGRRAATAKCLPWATSRYRFVRSDTPHWVGLPTHTQVDGEQKVARGVYLYGGESKETGAPKLSTLE